MPELFEVVDQRTGDVVARYNTLDAALLVHQPSEFSWPFIVFQLSDADSEFRVAYESPRLADVSP